MNFGVLKLACGHSDPLTIEWVYVLCCCEDKCYRASYYFAYHGCMPRTAALQFFM